MRSFARPPALLTALFLLLMSLSAPAQTTRTVSGKVVDGASGKPLAGVTVTTDVTAKSTLTDQAGNFSIQVSSTDKNLVFSFVGMTTFSQPLSGANSYNISMEQSASSLNEVVVIGYGTQKKSDLTGSISSVKVDSLAKGVSSSVTDLIKGRAPGVQVVQNSSAPGGGVSISIRGASSINAGTGPLYVIDGLPVSSSPLITGSGAHFPSTRSQNNILSTINPSDIKSIEILKDASATAIYGARGANGVILITTKQGSQGQVRIGYNSYVGFQNVGNKLDILNAQEYQTVMNGIIDDGGGDPSQRVTTIANGGKGTDWQDAIFRKSALVQSHELSFSGGSKTVTYYMAANYFDQDGIVINNNLKRYSARVNLVSHFTDKLELGLNLSSSYSKNVAPPTQSFGVNEDNGALYAAYNMDPTLPIKDSNGVYVLSPYITTDNPVALANGKIATENSYRTFGTIYGKYELLPGLSLKLNIGGDIINQDRGVYVSQITVDGAAQGGIATVFHGRLSNYLVEGTANYDKTFGEHRVNLLAGITTQKFTQYNTNMSANNFPSDGLNIYNIGLGDPTNYNIYSHQSSNRLLSYIGRANYAFRNKYLLTATLRIDGSSRFGTNNKFGYFPSFAFGWKIKDEDFMQDLTAISQLKLRASWGQTGNDEIGDYQSIPTYGSGPTAVMDGQLVTTTEPSRLATPDLKWETTEQTDIGLDFGLFHNRITGSIDYFYKKTFDMLIQLPVPTTSGFTTKLSNIGSLENRGIDVSLSTQNIIRPDFSWDSYVNLSTLSNKVLNLGGIQSIISGGAGFASDIFMTMPGEPLRAYYGYQIIGVWQTKDDFSATKDPVQPGDLKYLDVNGDSVVNASDRVLLGNSFPKFSWSFGNTVTYKNFELNFLFLGVQGISMFNDNLVDTYFPINFRRNKMAKPYLDRWTPNNPSNTYPSFINPLNQGQKSVNSYTVQDAAYLRLQSVRLSYTLPHLTRAIRSATVYITGENLFTVTNYDGVDPAVNPNGTANSRIDYNAYPLARTFLFGLQLGL